MSEFLPSNNEKSTPKPITEVKPFTPDVQGMTARFTEELFDNIKDSVNTLNAEIAGKTPEEIQQIVANEKEECYMSMLKYLPMSKALEMKPMFDIMFQSISGKILDGNMSDSDFESLKNEMVQQAMIPKQEFSPILDASLPNTEKDLADLNKELAGKTPEEIKMYLKNQFYTQQNLVRDSNMTLEEKFNILGKQEVLFQKIENYALDGNVSASELLELLGNTHDMYFPFKIEKHNQSHTNGIYEI